MSASLLPNGEQTFLDDNGNPLASGTVTFYVPGTSTPKNTWRDSAQTQLNTNPVVLDAAGRAIIYGDGSYRMVLQDALGNTIYDQLTDSPISSASLSNTTGSGGTSLIGFNGGTLADYLKNNSSCVVPSIATLRSLDSTLFTKAFVLGYYAAGDGGGGEYFVDSADTSSLDNGGTIIVAADSARWKTTERSYITSRTFGAKGDRTTDDTTRLQAYINWCLAGTYAIPMIISGQSKITASLNIDRAIDSTLNDFRIISDGTVSGFYINSAVTIFSSTINQPGTDPVSEFVTCENLFFEADAATTAAFVASQKLMRTSFLNCTFEKIRCMNAATAYTQTWRFLKCRIRHWGGYFFASVGSFDIDFSHNIIEHGNSLFRSYDASGGKGSVGNRFIGNLFEGSNAFIESAAVQGLDITGNYIEANTGLTLNMGISNLPNAGVRLSGNLIFSTAANVANTAFYECQWGISTGCSSNNNYFNGRAHDQSAMTVDYLDTRGDVAVVELVKGNKTGITDANRTGIAGNWTGLDATSWIQYMAHGGTWIGMDANFGGIALSTSVTNAGKFIPLRLCFGTVNPQQFPASYGNPYWAAGSHVMNSAPSVGSPKGWYCTVSGQPGTWVSEGNL
ncbi:hypothetical protein FP568_15660 [Pandoraea pnomenusa]|uniref:hypothetical protein n=1 Tax=Pandoraea pnomenusa TaxID=93220 RepID=UPI001198313D|nr:hypothetical protein [Pandoraea pnomenusa]QDX22549.1 hypothetical protein FP568_15660 [Pandoraea pnomenusa]